MAETIDKLSFAIQWHVTDRCDQSCKHCYAINSPEYQNMILNELSFESCKLVIDNLIEFCEISDVEPRIVYTGGDPLLRDDFIDLLEYGFRKGITGKILGNPYHLDRDLILKLKSLGINGFQLSLDGLKSNHDTLRKPGSFDATCDAVSLLEDCGMPVGIMFTLSRFNKDDLIPCMYLSTSLGAHRFNFARLVPEYDQLEGELISATEYKDLLAAVYDKMEELRSQNVKTRFGYKDHLWSLFFYERGDYTPPDMEPGKVLGGCNMGGRSLAVLADGTVYACRRFTSPIGKLPEDSLLDIYISDELDKYRELAKFEKCIECPLHQHCRGCPAVAFSFSKGNCYAPDPQCWH